MADGSLRTGGRPLHLFHPATGQLAVGPGPEALLGCYYLTWEPDERFAPLAVGRSPLFATAAEVELAVRLGKRAVRDRIWFRLPTGRPLVRPRPDDWWRERRTVEETDGVRATTPGRVLFNDLLPDGMPFYDLTLTRKHVDRVLMDCFRQLGPCATNQLAEQLNRLGSEYVRRSGLSFAISDLPIPPNRDQLLRDAAKEVAKIQKQYDRGIICNAERFNKVIDYWTYARDLITRDMMEQVRTGGVPGRPAFNPVYHMANSGAAGRVEHIRRLAGMVGLTASPSGEIQELPVTHNLRDGLPVVSYFQTTFAVRRELAWTASRLRLTLRLTRRVLRAVGDEVISVSDCGTTSGVWRKTLYRCEEQERPLADLVCGRVSAEDLYDERGNRLVSANELITPPMAENLERAGVERLRIRSPLTCRARHGVCQRCYGTDPSTGQLVEQGVGVGILAALSLSYRAPELRRRFFLARRVSDEVTDAEWKARHAGVIAFRGVRTAPLEHGGWAVLSPLGELQVRRSDGPILDRFRARRGMVLKVADGQPVAPGTVLCKWDPYLVPVLSDVSGVVAYADVIEGQTLRREKDYGGSERPIITEHDEALRPRIVVRDDGGAAVAEYPLYFQAYLEVCEGDRVEPGAVLARLPRMSGSSGYEVGGLEEVAALLNGRPPKDRSVLAEASGTARIGRSRAKRGSMFIQPYDDDFRPCGPEIEQRVPDDRRIRPVDGEYVEKGSCLTNGQAHPRDLLRLRGAETAFDHLRNELRVAFADNQVELDDHHLELIVARMFRYVRITVVGDTRFRRRQVVDRIVFDRANERLRARVVVEGPGDSLFPRGRPLTPAALEREFRRLDALGGVRPTLRPPVLAASRPLLIGIHQLASRRQAGPRRTRDLGRLLAKAAVEGALVSLADLQRRVIEQRLLLTRSPRSARIRL